MERKLKGFKIATIVVSIIAVAAITTLSIFLGVASRDRAALGNDIEGMYQRAYYELISNINSIEINLSKLLYTSSRTSRIELLSEIAKNSQMASTALSTLSAENFGIVNTTRYINQTGDFAAYLLKEVADGKGISEDDYEIIGTLYEMTVKIGNELAKINDEINKGEYNFTERLKMNDDIFIQIFTNLEEQIVNYPALIYDGPFSAAMLEKEPKGLTGEDITQEQGVAIINELLHEFGVKDIKFTGENNSYFMMYNYEATYANGDNVAIELSKKGGHLVMLNVSRAVEEPELTPEECAELAEQYLRELGYNNMKSVWVSNYNSIIYINLAPEINGIIYYPDLVKVKIASNDGELLGVEALSYIYNHTTRTLPTVALSESEARSRITTKITVETGRLALIPHSKGKEYLTYEFSGRVNDNLYYIYIDVTNGEEVRILRVIDSDEGTLLM